MLIDSLTFALEKSGCLDTFWGKLDREEDAILGVASSARPFLVAARFIHKPQATLVVVAGEENAVAFARKVASYIGDERVLRFPERTDYPFNPKPANAALVAERMEAAFALSSGREVVVVVSARALLRMLPPREAAVALPIVLEAGKELSCMGKLQAGTAAGAGKDATKGTAGVTACSANKGTAGGAACCPTKGTTGGGENGFAEGGAGATVSIASFEELARALEERGYENTGKVDGPGTFAVRGGTVDIFPGNLMYPVRLDFFGDELDEMRRIIPSTGQTISALPRAEIYPVVEFSCSNQSLARARKKLKRPAETNPALRTVLEKLEGGLRFDGADVLLPYVYNDTATLGDYLPDGALSVLIEPRSLFDDMVGAYDDIAARAKGSNLALKGLYAKPESVNLGKGQRASYVSLMRAKSRVDDELPVKRVDVAGNPDILFERLRSLIKEGYTLVFSAADRRVRQDMELAFVDYGLPIQECLDDKSAADDAEGATKCRLQQGVVNVVDADVPLGMIIPKARLALISVEDTQPSSVVRTNKPVDITKITFPYKPGDYVVHAAHGVAHFKELVRREIDATTRDYLLLEYAQGDKLYVPVEQLDRVTRYVGPDGASPRLTRLNTADWSRALKRVHVATKKLAFDLVDVYARRATAKGYRFTEDTAAQREMEESFPYQETPDQLAAIADVKADMESSKPMDRLICGDVGFGKTEVALRAAFKAVQDGKQVMVLCPTTILAQQHYINFNERFEPYGIKVEVLSRFRTPVQQEATLTGFAAGNVQVLVGTHRLLSRDVNPRDLGLVVIDEEQRFGVGHKEQLKNLRESVDVLTLTATPIPRTLQMSLSGVRDMSLILTPPDERRPVEVYVGEWDPGLVSAAIRRELARKGQVYYVSNRVRSIDDAVARVTDAAGAARVGVAHGQMTREELERVMEDFSAGELDVLVATTIIESGIDNPHTNTLIIEDSQRLGLAQMYQLKGRVGRSSVQAYAFFMFPGHMKLTEEATARLTALYEHTDLGSGMNIAMRDLEIRGAGSLLGAEQSGNMSAVGFDLFAQMLAQAVNATREGNLKLMNALPPALSDITVNVPGHTYLPEDFIPDIDERVLWYRKIASASTEQAVEDVRAHLMDRHPDMPQAAKSLLDKARLKAFANAHHIKTISIVAGRLIIEPVDPAREKITNIRRAGGRYLPDKHKLQLPLRYFKLGEDDSLLEAIAGFLTGMLADN